MHLPKINLGQKCSKKNKNSKEIKSVPKKDDITKINNEIKDMQNNDLLNLKKNIIKENDYQNKEAIKNELLKKQLDETNKLINEVPAFEFLEKNKSKNKELFDKLDKSKIDEVKEIRINIDKETKDEIIPFEYLENKNNEIKTKKI